MPVHDFLINPFKTFGGKNPFSMGASKEEERLRNLRDYKEGNVDLGKRETDSPEYLAINNEIIAVQREARIAAFQGAQKGAPQSYVSHGGPRTKYKSTSMFPTKGTSKSDPSRLQANPVGYDKEEWWRQSPYRSPVQENYSIFSMKPYSW